MGRLDVVGFHRAPTWALLISLLIIQGSLTSACQTGCTGSDDGKLRFLPGHVYSYHFNSDVAIGHKADKPQENSVKVVGDVELYPTGNCGYTLRLTRVSITSGTDQYDYRHDLEKPVQFSMTNGELSSEICADPRDTEFSLNIKRGLVSMFQSSNKKYETDVFGRCPTAYSTVQDSNSVTVTKVRSLGHCGYRENLSNGFVYNAINEQSGVKSLPLLYGDYTMETRFENGLIVKVDLTESYKFNPFQHANDGVSGKVVTALTYVSTNRGGSPQFRGVSKTIIFEKAEGNKEDYQNTARDLLKGIIAEFTQEAGPNAAGQFVQLIRVMRHLSLHDFVRLFAEVRNGQLNRDADLSKKVYLDALFRTGTGASVQAVIKLLRERQLSETEEKLAYLSFNLVTTLTKEALDDAATLLDANPSDYAYLSIGNLVSVYCKKTSCSDADVDVISKKLVGKLNRCSFKTPQEQETLLYVLKGIRNTHKLASSAVDALVQCASAKNPSRVRVAAIQAFSAASCQRNLQNGAWSILKNRGEDSELRIEAYLALVACPTANFANNLAELLNTETVYQVGTFITTHLQNIRTSTDPSREAARYHLGNVRLSKKFPFDLRRYSFNHENSYAFDSFGFSASEDTNVIYSQNSFLPRSVRFNLTGELFGYNFNLLEFSARQENLELLLENYFGPKGFFNTKEGREKLLELGETVRRHPRSVRRQRRQIRNDVEQFARRVKFPRDQRNDLLFDVSLKLFGNEMFFLSLGDNIALTPDDVLRQHDEHQRKAAEELSDFNKVYQFHTLFLDNEIIYPTGIGFPLELSAQGAAVTKMKASARLNLDNLLKDWKNVDVKFGLSPSANVEISGSLRINAYYVNAGLRVSGSVHTATGSDVTFQSSNDGNDFKFDLELPKSEQDLFSLRHNVELVTEKRGVETATSVLKPKQQKGDGDCFEQLSKYVGVEICFKHPDFTATGVTFPTSYPVEFGLKLKSALKFSLSGSHTMVDTVNKYNFRFDTPNSQVRRLTDLEISTSYDQSNFYVSFDLKHPAKALYAKLGYINQEDKLGLYGEYKDNGKENNFNIGLKKTADHGTLKVYQPDLHVTSDGKTTDSLLGYRASGEIKAKKTDKEDYQFVNFRVDGPENRFVTFNGNVEYHSTPLTFVAKNLQIETEHDTHVVDTKLIYDGTKHLLYDGKVKNVKNENFNTHIVLERLTNATGASHTVVFAVGPDFRHRYEVTSSYNVSETGSRKISFKNGVVITPLQFSGKLNGALGQDDVEYDIEASMSNSKLGSTLSLHRNANNFGDLSLDLAVYVNRNHVSLSGKTKVDSTKTHYDYHLKSSYGVDATLVGHCNNKQLAEGADVSLSGKLKLGEHGRSTPYEWTFKLLGKSDSVSSSAKVSKAGDQLFYYDFVSRQNDPACGTLDLYFKDLLKVDGTLTCQGTSGNLDLLMYFNRLNKKAKLETSYTVAKPQFNIDSTLYFDYDGDRNKQLKVKSHNTLSKDNFQTDGFLTVNGETYTFSADGRSSGALGNGDTSGKFAFALPNQRTFRGQITRRMVLANGESSGFYNIAFYDEKDRGAKRYITLDTKINQYNPTLYYFDTKHVLKVVDFDSKDFVLTVQNKHLPKDHFKSLYLDVNLAGSALEVPETSLVFDVSEYCEKHAVFDVKLNQGQRVSAHFNGNYHVSNEEKKEPATFKFAGILNAPNTEVKTFSVDASGSFLLLPNENNKYDTTLKLTETYGDKTFTLDLTGHGNENKGTYDVKYKFPEYDNAELKGSYVREDTKDVTKYGMESEYYYGREQLFKVKADVAAVDEKSVSVHYVLDSKMKDVKSVNLMWKMEKTGDTTYTTNSHLTYDGKSYSFNNVATLTEDYSAFDLTVVYPENTAKLSGSVQRISDRSGKAKLNIQNFLNYNFVGSLEANLKDFENFYLKFDADSSNLKLNKFELEIKTKVDANGKAVDFKATEDKKNVLSGTAQYSIVSAKDATTITGDGMLQLHDKASKVHFDLTRQVYTEGSEGLGFSYKLKGSFGSKNVVSELSVRTKEFKIKLAACEANKPCTNIELSGVSSTGTPNRSNEYKVLLLVDLRELGYPYEFELNSHTSRDNARFYHDFEVSFMADNNRKYKYVFTANPKQMNMEFHLPSRKIVLNAESNTPEQLFGRYEYTVALYMNKDREPNDVSKLTFVGNLAYEKEAAFKGDASLQFYQPSLSKPLVVSGDFEYNKPSQLARGSMKFDVFKSPHQMVVLSLEYKNQVKEGDGFNITTEAVASSQGLGFRYYFGGHSSLSLERKEVSSSYAFTSATSDLHFESSLYATPNRYEIIFKGFNEEVFRLNGVYDENTKVANFEWTLRVLGTSPIHFNGETKGLSSATAKLYREDNLFDVQAAATVGQQTSFTVRGNGRPLVHVNVQFSRPDVVATDYQVHEQEIDHFLEMVLDKVAQDNERVQHELTRRFQAANESYQRQLEELRNALPDMTRLNAKYQQHFNAIFDELASDPDIKKFIEHVKNIYEAVYQVYETTSSAAGTAYTKVYTAQTELYNKAADAFKNNVLPELQKTARSLFKFVGKFNVEILKLTKIVIEQYFNFLKNFDEYLSRFSETFMEYSTKAGEFLKNFYETVKKDYEELCRTVKAYTNNNAYFDSWKAEFDKFTSDWSGWKKLVEALNDVLRPVKELLPTEEFRKFVDLLEKYIEAKFTTKTTDDVEELKSLYFSFVDAIRSVIVDFKIIDPASTDSFLPITLPTSLDILKYIPSFKPGKLSILNDLRREELHSLSQFFLSKFEFELFPPFDMRGHIADGQNVFTFDGRHFRFPGSCSYILAQDFKHGNFSLVATMEGGKLKSITLIDKENVVEVNNEGIVKLNDAKTDLPLHQQNIHSWRRYYTVSILTEYGVKVTCTLDLRVCHFNVNGYYLGRTRGLLGNGNQEPSDDYLMPNGKIIENPMDFGNAYGLRSCKPSQHADHGIHEVSPLCKELFGTQSMLALGYLFIDHHPYYEACNHAVAESQDKEDAACNVALAYASAARLEKLPVMLPPQCGKCGEHKVGDEYEATLTNKADFVFVVDKRLSEQAPKLLKRLLDSLKTKLKERNIVDVRIVVIGYHENEIYSSLFTLNGKLDSNGNISNQLSSGPKKAYIKEIKIPENQYGELMKTFVDALNTTFNELQPKSDAEAFNLAMAYPFRSDARKVIVAVRTDSLEYPKSWRFLEAGIASQMVRLKGVSLHYIGPLVEMKKINNFVGFNSKHALLQADASKSSNLGSVQQRNNFKYKSDMGIDIVQSNGGYVFSLTRYLEADSTKPKARPNIINTIANALADHTARTKTTYLCSCHLAYGLHAEELCLAKQIEIQP